jgi:drug/metabolite transporter (DMT)-like permease
MVACALIAAVALQVGMRAPAGTRLSIVWLGFVNVSADLFYLLATREGLLSLVAVITSMYPASTVALARLVLGERTLRKQQLGLATAAVSVVLIALE